MLTNARAFSAVGSVEVDLSNLGDTDHFEFSGHKAWNYNLIKKKDNSKDYYEVSLPPFSNKAIEKLKNYKGGIVKNISVDPKGGVDGSTVIKFHVESSLIESFDYQTDQPSRLIIDFYPKKVSSFEVSDDTEKQIKNATKKLDKNKLANKLPEKKLSNNRKPATADVIVIKPEEISAEKDKKPDTNTQSGIYDGSDPGFRRFLIQDYEIREDAIIQSREKDYLDFPMLHEVPSELQTLLARKPVYEIVPTDSKDPKKVEENKMARLLVTLFKNKRYLVFLKTADWFYEKFPQSDYDEIIRFMWADTHYALYEEDHELKNFDMAMARYRDALTKYPQSQLAERTLLLMGFSSLDRGDYLGTLRLFQQHLAKLPASSNRDISRLAIAEGLLKLNQYDEAWKQLDAIEKDALNKEDKMRAAYMKGDVNFQNHKDEAAIKDYRSALTKYPEAKKDFPNALYNQAAALFRQKQYKDSLVTFKDFLTQFPTNEYAGYAMTRVGELLDILGADPVRVMGAYLETYFRYGDTPSSVVAKLRLVNARMKSMKPKELSKAVDDMMSLAKQSKLPKIEQFATMLISDGYSSRNEYDKAIDLLVKYYQDNATSADTTRLKSKIVKNINEKIRTLAQSGDFIQTLKTHNKYADTWLKDSDRLDTKFWVGRAFEESGVFKEASKIYRDTLNKVYSLTGTKEGKERSVVEKLPSTDYLHLRLAATEYAQDRWSTAYDQLQEIKKPESLSDKEQIERVQLGADLLEKRGETEYALRYISELIKTWRGVPALVAAPYFKAGEIELKLKKNADALKSFERVDELMADSNEVNPQLHAKALEKIAEIQLEQKQSAQAIATLEKLLKLYEGKVPLASLRYKLGQIHFDEGRLQKAAEVWAELDKPKLEFWNKLAQEQLRHSSWGSDYKKYMNRIPAMESQRNVEGKTP